MSPQQEHNPEPEQQFITSIRFVSILTESARSPSHVTRKLHFRATPGGAGKGSGMHGAMGSDCIVLVPPGTIIRRKDADEDAAPLAELVLPGEVYLGLHGQAYTLRGGCGPVHLTCSFGLCGATGGGKCNHHGGWTMQN